jgi:hypothetical protein
MIGSVGERDADAVDAGALTAALVAQMLQYFPSDSGDPTGTRASVKPPHPHPQPAPCPYRYAHYPIRLSTFIRNG